MTAQELNDLYGAIITPDAQVEVPEAWMPAVHEALKAFEVLPPRVRAFLIVVGIVEFAGRLDFQIAATPEYIGEEGLQMVSDIVERARVTAKGAVH